MATGNAARQDIPEPQPLKNVRTWASYVHTMAGMVDETMRVIKAGGLSEPGVAEHLLASRAAFAGPAPVGAGGGAGSDV